MAKKKDQSQELEVVKVVGIETDLTFMSFDRSNHYGRVRVGIDNTEGTGMNLSMSRMVIDTDLPEDFDSEKYEVTGKLSLSLTVSKK